jgi:GNAT superfamily N-acetyltransferase
MNDEPRNPPTILDFTPEDEAATLAFCHDIFDAEGWPLDFMDASISQEFDRPRDVFLLVKHDGEIIGCGALKELSAADALMTRFFVATDHRGTGLAGVLFEELCHRARQLGYRAVVLDVNRESARAIRFYEKQGMEAFIPEPHPRWLESAPEEQRYARYFRKRV